MNFACLLKVIKENISWEDSGCIFFHTTAASPSANYQILTPAFYDQSGQFVLGNGRGLGTPVRLVSPASILVNTATGQQGESNFFFIGS